VIRYRGLFYKDVADINLSGLLLYPNAHKKDVTLDLHDPDDHTRLDRLLELTDILAHNVGWMMPPQVWTTVPSRGTIER
jgi:hypothetical protein